MTFRHIAAVALVGWYLMLPSSLHQTLPLSKWVQAGSYDSASACEQHRNNMFETLDNHEARNMSVAAQDLNARLYFAGKCIASDDPRLAK
jgi:hypothetical protein